ncbi:MAG: ribonucleotide reductase subunit alpha [Methylococcaceae bacterium]|nr:ribonucleotide reductase subunit alpha [Methylococcaceae bacterium]
MLAAKQQPEPQRLLFVFLRTSLSKEAKDKEKQQFHSGQGGELQPIMCVDKNLDELGSFAELVEESKQMQQDWQIVLIAGLAGKNGRFPDASEAEQPLNIMVQTVEQGGDLSKYLAFDKEGTLIQFG